MLILVIVMIVTTALHCNPKNEDEDIECMVEIEQVNFVDYYNNYLGSLLNEDDKQYMAYYIGLCHYETIGLIFDRFDKAAACGLYPGLSKDGDYYLLINGLDYNGRVYPDENSIYRTPLGIAGFCTPACEIEIELPTEGQELNYPEERRLSLDNALPYVKNYELRNIVDTLDVQYFHISRIQYSAMRKLIEQATELSISVYGFLFTIASSTPIQDADSDDADFRNDPSLRILVSAFDRDLRLISDLPVYITSTKHAGLCPKFCD